ncbi:MAG: hypothetical protein NVSMB39_5500 [Candidatus Saccharimonadales bacterium]
MPARSNVLEIAIDYHVAEILLMDGAGLVRAAESLRPAGNVTRAEGLTADEIAAIQSYLAQVGIYSHLAGNSSDTDESPRRPRHSAP